MLKFECKDLGMDCNFVATGTTAEEVKKKAVAHAQTVHKDLLAKMTQQQIEDMYKTVARMTH